MRVYLTAYLRGDKHISAIEVPPMDAIPPVGATFHYDDYAWCVDHLSCSSKKPNTTVSTTRRYSAPTAPTYMQASPHHPRREDR